MPYKFKEKNQVPIYSWIPEIDLIKEMQGHVDIMTSLAGNEIPGVYGQLDHLASLPFAYHHIALMPDGHLGYGMPIGGVLATDGVVVPNAVGVDIGCGMCAVRTNLTSLPNQVLRNIMGEIRKVIPVGFNHNDLAYSGKLMPMVPMIDTIPSGELSIISEEYNAATKQIGTLGGGNHFIEIQKGDDGFIWIMVHSGSRNLGYKVAKHYNDIAVKLNERWHSSVPKKWELAFLPLDTDEAQSYLAEMQYCVDFALGNRTLMINRICNAFADKVAGFNVQYAFSEDTPLDVENVSINIAHNYASMENHYGKNVLVHRKGATLAREGTIGIIPGSQGTASYIVEGKGNPESFMSCSHGAGRDMGRKQAQRSLVLEDEIKKLDDQGIVHSIRNKSDLDEASGAYKDIDVVMANQKDLVDIKVKLSPLGVVKG